MPTPAWVLLYEGKDVSDDLRPMVTSITYTDNVHGKSDELEVKVENSSALWSGSWYPDDGDRLELSIGYEGEPLLPCGSFQVDKPVLAGPADTCTIGALAAGIKAPLRTKRTRGFENVSLADIAAQVAREHSLQLVGDPPTRVRKRLTQYDETDLAFLKRIAEESGYVFSVRGDRLVFYELLKLENAAAVVSVGRSQLSRYNFTGGTQDTYVACEVTYLDPETGKLVSARVSADDVRPRTSTTLSGSVQIPMGVLGLPKAGRVHITHGDAVKTWQRFLAAQSLYRGAISGTYDAATDRATRLFQGKQRIQVDGDVGTETYTAAIALGFMPDSAGPTAPRGGDVLRKRIRVETAAEAEDVAKALLRAANRLKV